MSIRCLKSIPPDTAKARFLRLADNHFQWWLRLPIVNLLWRRDFVRFAISLNFLIDQIFEALSTLNCLESKPAGGKDFSTYDLFPKLDVKPADLMERLERIVSLHNLYTSEREARRLLRETLSLGIERFELGFDWLRMVQNPSRPSRFRFSPNPEHHLLIAEELAVFYRTLELVAAIGVSGSVARDLADETSDLDLDIICSQTPAEDARYNIASRLADNADDIRLQSTQDSTTDEFFIGGVLIDVRYWVLSRLSKIVDTLEVKSYWDENALAHLDLMKAIWDPDAVIMDHKDRLEKNAGRIRSKRVSKSLKSLSQSIHDLQESSVRKPSRVDFFFALTDSIMEFFNVLSAMNNRWIIFPKYAHQWTEGMETCVPNFCSQVESIILNGIDPQRYGEIVSSMTRLFEEIQSLPV